MPASSRYLRPVDFLALTPNLRLPLARERLHRLHMFPRGDAYLLIDGTENERVRTVRTRQGS